MGKEERDGVVEMEVKLGTGNWIGRGLDWSWRWDWGYNWFVKA